MVQDRLASFTKGVKGGAMKGAVDKVISPVTAPVVEAINAKISEMHPNMQFTAPMIETLMKSALIMGMAEMVAIAAPALGGRFDPEKLDLISEFMREYAGEKFGTELVDSAVRFAPALISAFAEFSAADIKAALPEHKVLLTDAPETNATLVPKLVEEEEEEESQDNLFRASSEQFSSLSNVEREVEHAVEVCRS